MTNDNTTDTAAVGTYVTVHYRGTLEDGTEFDNSRTRGAPVSFTLGSGEMIEGFDTAITGMTVGETKNITLTSDQAYGDINPEAYALLESSDFPEDFPLETGQPVPLTGPDGAPMMGLIQEITDTSVKVDLNHPMAGKDLNFEIELVTTGDPGTGEDPLEVTDG